MWNICWSKQGWLDEHSRSAEPPRSPRVRYRWHYQLSDPGDPEDDPDDLMLIVLGTFKMPLIVYNWSLYRYVGEICEHYEMNLFKGTTVDIQGNCGGFSFKLNPQNDSWIANADHCAVTQLNSCLKISDENLWPKAFVKKFLWAKGIVTKVWPKIVKQDVWQICDRKGSSSTSR